MIGLSLVSEETLIELKNNNKVGRLKIFNAYSQYAPLLIQMESKVGKNKLVMLDIQNSEMAKVNYLTYKKGVAKEETKTAKYLMYLSSNVDSTHYLSHYTVALQTKGREYYEQVMENVPQALVNMVGNNSYYNINTSNLDEELAQVVERNIYGYCKHDKFLKLKHLDALVGGK